jgi:hypothetical protein
MALAVDATTVEAVLDPNFQIRPPTNSTATTADVIITLLNVDLGGFSGSSSFLPTYTVTFLQSFDFFSSKLL